MIDPNIPPDVQAAFNKAVKRFESDYPDTKNWDIGLARSQEGYTMPVAREGQRYAEHPIPVNPTLDMECSFFTALEQYRAEVQNRLSLLSLSSAVIHGLITHQP